MTLEDAADHSNRYQLARAALCLACLLQANVLSPKDLLAEPASRTQAVRAISSDEQGNNSGQSKSSKCGVDALVCVELTYSQDRTELELRFDIADGWHINAHVPLDDYLIPTSLVIAGVSPQNIIYPDPSIKSMSFVDAPLALYEGAFSIRAEKLSYQKDATVEAFLTFQTCSDDICLPPEDLILVLQVN